MNAMRLLGRPWKRDILKVRTPADLIRLAENEMKASGYSGCRHEIEWLLAGLLECTRLELYLDESAVETSVEDRFWSGIQRRLRGEALQYIIGDAEFYGAVLEVEPGVFIPRPETEQVVACLLRKLGQRTCSAPLKIMELGVGSGCISITLARHLDACVVLGIDVSYNALRLAAKNAVRLGVSEQVFWVQADWDSAIGAAFDCVVSNPPYIASSHVDRLPLDVRQEPRTSLDGGCDGMRDLLKILEGAPRWLRSGGILALECAEDQVESLLQHVRQLSWVDKAEPIVDLAGRPRGLIIDRIGNQHA